MAQQRTEGQHRRPVRLQRRRGDAAPVIGEPDRRSRAPGKLGEIAIIAFDEDPITLGGVREGTIAGTVVQDPYEWGYQGMKLMAKYLEGDKSVVPENELIIVPTKMIDKDNVDAFEAELKARING